MSTSTIDQVAELTSLKGAPATRAIQERALVALRKLVGADAVLLVELNEVGSCALLVGSSPSLDVSENLVRTAAGSLIAAPRDQPLVKKFTFKEKLVHLIAVAAGPKEWALVWLRGEESAISAATTLVRFAVEIFPSGGNSATTQSQGSLHELLGLAALPRRQRLDGYASKLGSLLGASHLHIVRHTGVSWKIVASNPSPLPVRRSSQYESVILAAREHEGISSVLLCPPEEDSPALQECARLFEGRAAALIPVSSTWIIIAVWSEPPPAVEDIRALVEPALPLLPLLGARRGNPWDAWKAAPAKHRKIWVVAAIATIVLLLFPFKMRVHAPLILEPSIRRFVAAPFDAILNKVHVSSGDLVAEGQLLAELDGKEVRERIAEIEAQAATANLQGASDLASSRFDDSALSILQAQKAGHELEVLRQREKNLKILAPVEGIVIEGELERAEGAALKLGRPIMEIAPLALLVVEVAVREDDSAYISPGQKVIIRLNALPNRNFQATIRKVNPRAETRDGRNVFVAEADLENSGGELRPGMKGSAVILANRQPLFWILFRKPWNTFRGWFFW